MIVLRRWNMSGGSGRTVWGVRLYSFLTGNNSTTGEEASSVAAHYTDEVRVPRTLLMVNWNKIETAALFNMSDSFDPAYFLLYPLQTVGRFGIIQTIRDNKIIFF